MINNVNNNAIKGGFETNFRSTIPVGRKKAEGPEDKVDIGGKNSGMTPREMMESLPSYPKLPALPPPPTPEKDLTVLFYMNGQYDDIGGATAEAMMTVEKTGPDENTHLVAQLGRNPYKADPEDTSFHIPVDGDWEGVRRYEIRQDDHKDLDVPLSEWEKLEPEMPKNPVLKYVIGEYHWEAGNKKLANKYYDEARACGMNEYIDNPKSESSKEIRAEFDAKSRHLDEAMVGKKTIASRMLEELSPKTKMSDPKSIENFVSWGMQKYPAKHYMLVVMAHGGAWMGASAMNPSDMAKGIEKGIEKASEATGEEKKIDALVFNSCYMGSTEAMSEFRDTADVTLVSENYATTGVFSDWDGIIDNLQKDMKEGKPFDPVRFANDTVEKYRGENKEVKDNFPDFFPWKRAYLTLTAVDNKKVGALADSWKKFNDECKKNKVSDSQLFSCVKKAKDYASSALVPRQVFGFYDQIRDLGGIMDEVNKSSEIPAPVKKAADQVKKALSDCVINEQHEGVGMEGSQGLTIWGPTNGIDVLFMSNAYDTDVKGFNKETGWSERLKTALKNVPKKVTQEFLKNYNEIRTLKIQIGQEGIEDKEKEKLQKDMEKLQDRNVELKKDMDFSIKREENLFKSREKKVQVERLEGMFDEEVEFAGRGTMEKKGIK